MFRLKAILLTLLMSAALLFAAEGDTHTFELQWQPEGFNERLGVEADRTKPFEKEPDFGEHKILRGQLATWNLDTEKDLDFIWDVTAGSLYVDLNGDGDLTNDPNGVLETHSDTGGRYQFHNFPEFSMSVESQEGVHHYRINATGQDYPSFHYVTFAIRSGYGGTVALYGQNWKFEIVDRLRAQVDTGDTLSVRPTGQSGEAPLQNYISELPAPQRLFLDEHCYDMSFEFRKSESQTPALWCTLTERDVPLAKLRVEGQNINQLVLNNGEMLVLPCLGDEEKTVPVGDFVCQGLSLKVDEERTASPRMLSDIIISISADGENVLRAGGPLNQSVHIERVGKTLRFNYEIIGAGGEKYDIQQINNYDYNKKPSVAIYKGDLQVGSGSFEYG